MKFARRVEELPPYLFVGISRAIAAKKAQGIDVISFGIGDPDIPTPDAVLNRLETALRTPAYHRYPESEGLPEFRKEVCAFYKRRFNVDLDPGDIALVPDPAYPVYEIGTMFAGGTSHFVPLTADNDWLPRLDEIPADVARNAKVLWLNYPNNPTGATASLEFFAEAVRFAREFDIALLHDACYTEVTYDGYVAPSILQVEGARDIAMEFHSLSKTANMTGWRIGMAVGNSEMVNALMRVKSNIDSGLSQAVQEMGMEALNLSPEWIHSNNEIYRRRRDRVVSTLREIGIDAIAPKAGLYIWVPTPEGYSSAEFAQKLLEERNVVVTPGNGYGPAGEGYIRLSLTIPDELIDEGISRLSGFKLT